MIRHHRGGAAMAAYAAEPLVRNLARTIRTSQSTETDVLTSMVRARGAEPLEGP